MSYITEQNQPPGWYPESTGETSGDVTVRHLSVVENGTYTAPSGTAYSPVDVNVEAGLTAEALSVVANGTYTAPSGKAYTPVNVNVPVGATTQSLTVTENGTYTAPSGSAYTPVVVNVPSGTELPSVISKLDGGSFTLASDTKCSVYSISTALNAPAKYMIVWTDELNSVEAISYKSLVVGFAYIRTFEYSTGVTRYGAYYNLQRQANGDAYNGASTLNYANNPEQWTNNNMIRFYAGDVYYLAGVTYKWIAMA